MTGGSRAARDRSRVAFFTNNYRPRVSGVAVAVDFVERGLRAAGHPTLVVAPTYFDDGRDDHRHQVRRVRSLQLRRVGAAIPFPQVDSPLATVERFAPDVLHAHHPFLLGRAALAAADALHRPLVYTFHTAYESFLEMVGVNFGWVRGPLRAYVRRFVEQCDLVVAPTEPVRRHLTHDLGVSIPVEVAPTGLDRERFAPADPARRAALRAELGLDGHAPLLVWAGRVSDEKSPGLALDALAALVERGRDAALLYLGQGRATAALERRARSLGLERRVKFAGFAAQDRLPERLALGDVFLFTSFNDTQGIVAYEAWAAGLPIVAVPSMAGRAAVEGEGNGLLAEANGVAFAEAVEALVARPELGAAPFPWERYGLAALAERWRAIYDDAILLGRRRAEALRVVPASVARSREPEAPDEAPLESLAVPKRERDRPFDRSRVSPPFELDAVSDSERRAELPEAPSAGAFVRPRFPGSREPGGGDAA